MRMHQYGQFLSSQLSYDDIVSILGEEDFSRLNKHLGGYPAIFSADSETNEEAHKMAMNSKYVCSNDMSDDVVVYTCDGKDPLRKGTYFVREGKSYLAYCGNPNIDFNRFDELPVLSDVLSARLEENVNEEE